VAPGEGGRYYGQQLPEVYGNWVTTMQLAVIDPHASWHWVSELQLMVLHASSPVPRPYRHRRR